jgi:hypothetical protein
MLASSSKTPLIFPIIFLAFIITSKSATNVDRLRVSLLKETPLRSCFLFYANKIVIIRQSQSVFSGSILAKNFPSRLALTV